MNILLIGGSNFVILNGIRRQVVDILRGAGIDVERVENLAVGGTGSLMGLERLMHSDLNDINFEVVLVEYGVNDWGVFKSDPELWRVGFELLFFEIRRRWPSALMLNVLLGRRDERFWVAQSKLHAEMEKVAVKYCALNVNVDGKLKALSTPALPFSRNYRDDAHIADPCATHHVSMMVAFEILVAKVDNSINNVHLTQAFDRVMKYAEFGGGNYLFQNSQFSVNSKKINYGESFLLRMEGAPHVLSFVSTKQSGSFLVEFDGVKKIINTCQTESNQKLDFVIKHCPFEGVYDGSLKGWVDVRITAISIKHPEWDESLVQKVWAVGPTSEDEPSCFVINVGSIL